MKMRRLGSSWLDRVMDPLERRYRRALKTANVYLRSTHLYGPRRIELADSECAVVALIKDAEYFLSDFLRHHSALGVTHFLFIDNGSRDDTIEIITRHADVTVVRNTLPPYGHETELRRNIARRYIKGGWLLFLDADEMFTPPLDHPKPLSVMSRYCNENGYTAVVCQMLDMFSDLSLEDTEYVNYEQSLDEFRFYSLFDIKRISYLEGKNHFYWQLQGNKCKNAEINFMFGGIRKTLFEESCCLTKHSFVRNIKSVKVLTHPHCAGNVVCADFTALIKHYKFCGDFLDRERHQVKMGIWRHGQDRRRVEMASRSENFRLDHPNKNVYRGFQPLIEDGFLVGSAALETWLVDERRTSSAGEEGPQRGRRLHMATRPRSVSATGTSVDLAPR